MRTTPLAIVFLTATVAAAQIETPPAPAATAITDPAQVVSKQKLDVQPFTIEKLYLTREIGDSAWSPDNQQIAFISNMSGRNNLWIVSAGGGWPVQLTVSDQRQATPEWSPKGRWIAYASDYDGNEQWDIFLVSPQNGQVLNLTGTPEVSEENPAWSPDGERLAYSVKPKSSPNYEIDVIEVATRKVTHLTTNTPKKYSNINPIWSRDGKSLVFTQLNATGKDSSVVMADSGTGHSINLTPHQGELNFFATDISPDGKAVLIISNAHNGYNNAGLLDPATKKISWLTNEKWDLSAARFSPDGKRAIWAINVDGNQDLLVYDLATRRGSKLPLPAGVNKPAGAETPFARNGARLLYAHDGPSAPNDLWIYDFATHKSSQVTHSLVGGLRGEDMVAPFLVHYPSKDGKWQISAFVYVPFNAQRTGKNAAVVYIHGGPDYQTANWFNRNLQYLANQGFFVIAPNYRGSTGYGKEFADSDRFDMGGGDLDDVISAADWIKRTGFIDPKKIAVVGPSYGGYLTMMAVTKAPDLWAAGVPIIPFVNWFTELENEDPLLRESDLALMGDPIKEKARYQDRSPVYFVDQIKAPLLLLAGGNDPRCPRTEAEQVAGAIKKRNGVVELKVYENEGHGFAKVENQIDAYSRVANFLKKYAPPEDCGCKVNE